MVGPFQKYDLDTWSISQIKSLLALGLLESSARDAAAVQIVTGSVWQRERMGRHDGQIYCWHRYA